MIFSRKKKIAKPVSDDNKESERCVLCHELTDVKKNTPPKGERIMKPVSVSYARDVPKKYI